MINKGVGMSGMRILTLLASIAIVFAAMPFVRPTTVKAEDLAECTGSFIAYWQLGETSGSTYNDCAPGSNNDATVRTGFRTPVPAAGKVGGGQEFERRSGGATAAALVAPSTDFDFAANQSFAFEMWVKGVSGTTCATSTGNEVFIGRASTTNNVAWWVGCQGGTGRAYFSVRSAGGTATTVASSASIVDGQFHHIAAVRDAAANALIIYVDGAEAGRTPYTTSTDFTTDAQISLGSYNVNIQGYYYTGILDEVAAYNTLLSPQTIASHAASGQPYSVDTSNLDETVYLPLIQK